MSFERFLRSLHAWLGICILPWVVVAGFTGFYMNHGKLILSLLPDSGFDVTQFDTSPLAKEVTRAQAFALARSILPDVVRGLTVSKPYLGRESYRFDGGDTDVIVDQKTGHYWVTGRYMRQTFAPDGARLDTVIRWSRVLSSLHTRGWVGTVLGTWLADITAGALMVFGISGLYLFSAPRLRRAKNRRARAKAARQ
jgi:hypothetical protein